ncbi:MAG TPA: GNAT family protein [Thermomicrobiaceae bacterium]|nr:GNAT family protein [Thermomicrobiaceae bacterium]
MDDLSRDGPPVINISGERVLLGPLRRDLLPAYHRWTNDFSGRRTLGGAPRPRPLEDEAAWYDSVATSSAHVGFTVYERASGCPIGLTSLDDLDFRNRLAEFTIYIGEPGARDNGYGTETTRLMLDYAFTALGLHSVWLSVFAFNLAGIRAYEKAGFRVVGRRREAFLMGGRYWDVIYMDCLAEEFTGGLLKQVFSPDVPRGGAGDADRPHR